jgi:hypothetical protein
MLIQLVFPEAVMSEEAQPAVSTGCCPKFDPSGWEGQVLEWNDKMFIKDRVKSFLHIPLNFGAVMKRNMDLLQARPEQQILVLSDENSLWGADVYIESDAPIQGASMAKLSGRFKTRVFEGHYKNVPQWMKTFREELESKGEQVEKMLVYYTTCPKCAKAYGKNYVVFLAKSRT